MVKIIVVNYLSLDIRNDVSVTVMAFPGTSNASQNGMQLIRNKREFRIFFTYYCCFSFYLSDYVIIQSGNEVRIVSGSQSAEFHMLLEDDDIVEGVERVTLIMSGADIIGINQDAVDTAGEETVVFIEDNDGMSNTPLIYCSEAFSQS